MNEHVGKDGKHYSQGAAGGGYTSREDRDASISKGMKNIAGYFRILLGKPRTTGQKIMKVFTWVVTIIVLGFLAFIIIVDKISG